jgi:hypothetical protein
MGPSLPISIFAVDPQTPQRPVAYMVSAVSHVVVAGLILYGFIFAPRINMNAAAERYTLREVSINLPDPVRDTRPLDSADYPGQQAAAKSAAPHAPGAAAASSIRQIPKLHLSDRTIVQPDIPVNQLVMKHTLPSLLLWSANRPKIQLITPPQPQKMAWVDTKPVLTRPTPEQHISEIPITSTPFNTKMPMPLPGSSTPIVARGPMPAELIPETSSLNSSDPSAAAMMSISEQQLAKGSIALPPVNQTAAGNENGSMRPGESGNSAFGGHGDPNSQGSGKGLAHSQGGGGNSAGPAGGKNGTVAANGAGTGNGNNGGNSTLGGSGGQGAEPTYTRVKLPTSGEYGVVVVGSELAEEFPETSRLWGTRVVYSVYLHVGLARNWILQYTLPPTADGAAAGNMTHVEAPWPFYIVRPPENPVVAADALMIHGFVNQAGHFEALNVVFPAGYGQAQYVLQALRQWQFRPAKHDGQIARVEILLIIPQIND